MTSATRALHHRKVAQHWFCGAKGYLPIRKPVSTRSYFEPAVQGEPRLDLARPRTCLRLPNFRLGLYSVTGSPASKRPIGRLNFGLCSANAPIQVAGTHPTSAVKGYPQATGLVHLDLARVRLDFARLPIFASPQIQSLTRDVHLDHTRHANSIFKTFTLVLAE